MILIYLHIRTDQSAHYYPLPINKNWPISSSLSITYNNWPIRSLLSFTCTQELTNQQIVLIQISTNYNRLINTLLSFI